MAFSRTPLISFLLISLLFASSMAQSPAPASAPTSLPPSASKTRPVAAPSPSKITPFAGTGSLAVGLFAAVLTFDYVE
ncbi:hypothetical protein Pint_18878 [Pistacia integerrima]|uniref:Uncharacterized protein n=1 Tax=Pistacia integerrima TaxID=434235 RepID=A0ACC0YYA9_9ROSI|nr:hypothetical protein Pint_18878 [Pistacia integerrima]